MAWHTTRRLRGVGRGAKLPSMAKIKHIAISTQDVEGTARFYIDVFGLKEVGKVDSPGASGYYLSDGDLNLAILQFKTTRSPAPSAARTSVASTTLAFRWTAWTRSPHAWPTARRRATT